MKRVLITSIILTVILLLPYPTASDILYQEAYFESNAVTVAEAAALQTQKVWITAYSSTPEETDSTPYTTAKNTPVREGIIAANFLPFGTVVKIPALFGNKKFVVEDRMHRRKTNFIDVWMPTKEEAEEFGIHYTDVTILD